MANCSPSVAFQVSAPQKHSIASACSSLGALPIAGKVFLNSIEYLDPVSMEWTTFVNRQADAESRSESASTSRRESILAPVDEEVGEQKPLDQTDSSGNESDEHSS